MRTYLDTDEEARAAWTEWAAAHGELEGSGLGETFDSGIATIEEPDELRGGQWSNEGFASTFERAQRV